MEFRAALTIFVIGTSVSVLAGGIGLVSFDSQYQSISIALLLEIVVVVLTLALALWEFKLRLFQKLEEQVIYLRASSFVANENDELLSEKFAQLAIQIEHIAEGKYHLTSLAEVYDDDIRSIRKLVPDSTLSSLCPIGGDAADAEDQLSNQSYLASISEHKKAAERGARVDRIYIVSKSKTLESTVVQEHLADLGDSRVNVFYLSLDDSRFSDAMDLPHDFLILGNRKVSIGRVGRDARISGGDVFFDKRIVDEYSLEFDRLKRISTKYSVTKGNEP